MLRLLISSDASKQRWLTIDASRHAAVKGIIKGTVPPTAVFLAVALVSSQSSPVFTCKHAKLPQHHQRMLQFLIATLKSLRLVQKQCLFMTPLVLNSGLEHANMT